MIRRLTSGGRDPRIIGRSLFALRLLPFDEFAKRHKLTRFQRVIRTILFESSVKNRFDAQTSAQNHKFAIRITVVKFAVVESVRVENAETAQNELIALFARLARENALFNRRNAAEMPAAQLVERVRFRMFRRRLDEVFHPQRQFAVAVRENLTDDPKAFAFRRGRIPRFNVRDRNLEIATHKTKNEKTPLIELLAATVFDAQKRPEDAEVERFHSQTGSSITHYLYLAQLVKRVKGMSIVTEKRRPGRPKNLIPMSPKLKQIGVCLSNETLQAIYDDIENGYANSVSGAIAQILRQYVKNAEKTTNLRED